MSHLALMLEMKSSLGKPRRTVVGVSSRVYAGNERHEIVFGL